MLSEVVIDTMLDRAWQARENAVIIGPTRVGATALDEAGTIHSGCNIEHRYRSHDIHAEVCALAGLIACGSARAVAIAVVADRELFTPCGACMDWVMQLGGPGCVVVVQREPHGVKIVYSASELMPHYPQ